MAASDPTTMLQFLRGRASDRKLRLFGVACCRRIQGLLDQTGREAVEVAERDADGLASTDEQRKMENLAWWDADGLNYEEEHIWIAGWAAHAAVEGQPTYAAVLAVNAAKRADEAVFQCLLLRDIFGNPFRPSPPLPAYVLAWNDRTVPRIAQAIYDDRKMPEGTLDTARLAILADALLDAGCEDEALHQHLREPGPHVRGCFAVDTLLGRE